MARRGRWFYAATDTLGALLVYGFAVLLDWALGIPVGGFLTGYILLNVFSLSRWQRHADEAAAKGLEILRAARPDP